MSWSGAEDLDATLLEYRNPIRADPTAMSHIWCDVSLSQGPNHGTLGYRLDGIDMRHLATERITIPVSGCTYAPFQMIERGRTVMTTATDRKRFQTFVSAVNCPCAGRCNKWVSMSPSLSDQIDVT
jgi:hypothetical protein